jgi:hypothetical protein
MAITAQYAAVPKIGIVAISTANTGRDGTGTLGTVFTAAASGSRIDALDIQATGTTTTGMIRLFVHNGTTAFLLTEVPVLGLTPGASSPAWSAQLNSNNNFNFPLVLATGFSLRASTNNAETFNLITTQAGDF